MIVEGKMSCGGREEGEAVASGVLLHRAVGGIAATASRSRAISAFAMFTSARRPAICASRCAIRAISTEGSEPTPAASWMADGEPTDAAIATTGGRTTWAH